MRYIKPKYFDAFKCIGGACPDTCCAGWQIVIDEDSLERYENMTGAFSNTLERGIDWEEGTFRHIAGRCSFLNKDNLCEIQKVMGEDYLCATCKTYPRHVEEFEGIREYSLALSCPEAAKLLMRVDDPYARIELTDDKEEEFDDMDPFLFGFLEDSRACLFEILQDKSIGIAKIKEILCENAISIQGYMDNDEYFKIDNIINKYIKKEYSLQSDKTDELKDKQYACNKLFILQKLELLKSEWGQSIQHIKTCINNMDQKEYENMYEEYVCYLQHNEIWKEKEEQFQRRILYFFLLTYYCGAVYDGCLYSKVELALFSLETIRMVTMLFWWEHEKTISEEEYLSIIVSYAKEVEHSDVNLNILETYFMEEYDKHDMAK